MGEVHSPISAPRPGRSPGSGRRPVVYILAATGAALLVGALTIPPLLVPVPASIYDLDPSWGLSLGVAIATHLQFGVQYVFPYGPLGFAANSYRYPAAWVTVAAAAMTVAGHLLYLLGFALFGYVVGRQVRPRPYAGVAIILFSLFAGYWSGAGADFGREATMLSLIALALCLLVRDQRGAGWLALGAGFLLAVAALYEVEFLWAGVAELVAFGLACRFTPQAPATGALAGFRQFPGELFSDLGGGRSTAGPPASVLGSVLAALDWVQLGDVTRHAVDSRSDRGDPRSGGGGVAPFFCHRTGGRCPRNASWS